VSPSVKSDLCLFATTSFNCGQLQTVLFNDGLYRKAPLTPVIGRPN